jgi:rRNA maturation protein Nop10
LEEGRALSIRYWDSFKGIYLIAESIREAKYLVMRVRFYDNSMTLVAKCRVCGSIFPSVVQIDQLDYGKTAILENRTEACPKCGNISNYNTSDYWYQS